MAAENTLCSLAERGECRPCVSRVGKAARQAETSRHTGTNAFAKRRSTAHQRWRQTALPKKEVLHGSL